MRGFRGERRQIHRDLHDGAQQRLVQTILTLRMATTGSGDGRGPAADLVDEALAHAGRALAAHGDGLR